jgi:hypothetical protein
MTTQAPSRPLAQPAGAPAPDHPTEVLDAAPEALIADALPLLDTRAQSRLVSPRMARRGPHLAVQNGDFTQLLPLNQKLTHVGRGTSADVRIDQHQVSGDHAIIVRHGRYARLLDNRSSNGTFLNGLRIVATNLSHGDVVRFGPVAMQYLEIDY